MRLAKLISVALFLVPVLAPGLAMATPVTLGDASGYSVFLFSSMTASSNDVQGRVAAAGNVSLSNYSINQSYGYGPAIVSNGNVSLTSGSILGTVYANQYTYQQAANNGFVQGNTLVNFAATQNLLSALSISLSSQVSGSTYNQWGGQHLVGNGTNGQQIFTLTKSQFEESWGYFADSIGNTQEIIVNVAGKNITVDGDTLMKGNNYSWQGNSTHVLYNFFEAETITFNGSMYGSVLAPLATIIANSGLIEGQIIANKWIDSPNGGTQVNLGYFAHNKLIPPQSSVPLPGAAWLFLSSIVLMACNARRRGYRDSSVF